VGLAACDPIWGTSVRLRTPANELVEDATVAVACIDDGVGWRAHEMSIRTTGDGRAWVGNMGTQFPPGCDIYVAKPGFHTIRIRYRDLCPGGADACKRNFHFDLTLVPFRTERLEESRAMSEFDDDRDRSSDLTGARVDR
jgi:hypothetical protein